MNPETMSQAAALAARLREEGHEAAAAQVEHATTRPHHGGVLVSALREACQTVLTAIEALDPKTQFMAEELRLEIDKKLT